ncbi:hypothetical protein B7494_g2633 [Chlorociboria aeruginascens]|nr:hypothetical protein B7494_g2633 [Chlorociboria aeruginascens]
MEESPPLPFMTRNVILMGITYSMGGFIYGYDTGQISGFLEMDNFKQSFGTFYPSTGTYAFPTIHSGLIVGLLSIGTLFGAMAAGPLADRLGRKLPILMGCTIYGIGAIVQISSTTHWYQVAIGRCIGGIGVGALSFLVPLATSETSPTNTRGFIVSGYAMSVTLGILIASLINFGTERLKSPASWRITMGFDFLWILLLAFGLNFVPESPKYVFSKGEPEKARSIMASLMGVEGDHPILQQEMKEMTEKLRTEQSHKGEPWWYVFRSREVCLRTLLATGILSFQQLTGANFFFYYGTSVFAAVGISNGYTIQIIISVVNVVCTFPGLYFAHNFSHRRCLFFGALWMGSCFLIYASVGHFSFNQNDPSQTPAAGAVLVTFTTLFIAAFASTWSPLAWGEAPAVCPAYCRATCSSVATAMYWVWNFLLAFFTPMITARINYLYGYVFSGCCLLMALMVQFFLLESRGRTLEELDSMYHERLGSDDE